MLRSTSRAPFINMRHHFYVFTPSFGLSNSSHRALIWWYMSRVLWRLRPQTTYYRIVCVLNDSRDPTETHRKLCWRRRHRWKDSIKQWFCAEVRGANALWIGNWFLSLSRWRTTCWAVFLDAGSARTRESWSNVNYIFPGTREGPSCGWWPSSKTEAIIQTIKANRWISGRLV